MLPIPPALRVPIILCILSAGPSAALLALDARTDLPVSLPSAQNETNPPDSISSQAPAGSVELTSDDIAVFPALRLEEILAYQAGMGYRVDWKNGTGLSVRGGEPEESGVFIDGVSARNRLTNIPFTGLPKGAVQSVGIRKGGFDAGYGDIRSGVVDLITKSGSRDKYSVYIDASYSQAGRKHFGPHAYDRNGTVWETFAGARAFEGIGAGEVNDPESLDRFGREYWTDFSGWDAKALEYATDVSMSDDDRTPQAALELWKWRHRPIDYGNQPDYMIDVSLGGPVPGGFIPILGRLLNKVTFQTSYSRERTAFPYPLTRDSFGRETGSLKLGFQPSPGKTLTISGLYGRTASVDSSGAGYTPDTEWGTRGRPDGTWWGMERSARYFMFDQMYNRQFQSRTTDHNFLLQTRWSHRLSSRTAYDLSYTLSQWNTFQTHGRWRDSTDIKRIGESWYDETPANYADYDIRDQLGMFAMGDGAGTRDYSWFQNRALKAGLTRIVRRRHHVSAGLEFNYTQLRDRVKGARSGSIPEMEPGRIPGTQFQWWDAEPRSSTLFVQDRIELDGLTAEIGLRRDKFDPRYHQYDLQDRYNRNYEERRWGDSFPVRWPEMATGTRRIRVKSSPRMAVTFPVDRRYRFHFNYGRYYQIPQARRIFAVRAPVLSHPSLQSNTALDWIRTTAYEFGGAYLSDYGFQVDLAGYYFDTGNLPGMIESYSYNRRIRVMNYISMGYGDRQGFELKLTKRMGSYLTGWAAYEYLAATEGVVGLGVWDEADLSVDRRNQISTRSKSRTRFNLSRAKLLANLGTPPKFGPGLFDLYPFERWDLSLFHLWEQRPPVPSNLYSDFGAGLYSMESLPHQETRLMVEKRFGRVSELTFYLLVENPFNRKELFDLGWNPSRTAYLHSLQPGDRWGEWAEDYIDLGFMDWYQFQHRRQFTFGVRMNIN